MKSSIKESDEKDIDFLVLGCTHYPFLIPQLKKIVGEKVTILDSGKAIARQTKVILEQENLINHNHNQVKRKFYTNTNPDLLQKVLNNYNENLKARKLTEYNDIYTEYSTLMLWCGAGFLIYSLVLILVELKRKSLLTNQNNIE